MEPARTSARLTRLLDGLQVALTFVVAFLALRGEVSQSLLLGGWLSLPFARGIASKVYRDRWRERLRRSSAELDVCAAGGGRLPWRAACLWIGLPVLVVALANGRKMSSFDNLPTNLMAASLVLEGDTELSEFTRVDGDPGRSSWPGELPYSIARLETGVRSVYPAGNLTFAVPVYALARLAGADLERGTTQWRLARGIATLLAAATAVLFLFLALPLTDRGTALWVGLMFGLGSSTLSTLSQGLFSQTGATFWIVLALLIEFRRELPTSWAARSPIGSGLLSCLALGCLFACRLTSVTFLVPFGLWMLWRDPRRAVLVTLGALLVFAPWGFYYWSAYGDPLGPQTQYFDSARQWGTDVGGAAAGLLVSPGRGLLVYQPWLLLPLALWVPGLRGEAVASRSSGPRGWWWFCLSVLTAHVALISLWDMWWGGHSWGSRLLAEALPCAALLLVPIVARLRERSGGRRLVAVAALLGFLMQANEVLGPGRKWNDDPPLETDRLEERVWDWGDPPFLYPLVRFRIREPR